MCKKPSRCEITRPGVLGPPPTHEGVAGPLRLQTYDIRFLAQAAAKNHSGFQSKTDDVDEAKPANLATCRVQVKLLHVPA